MDDFVAFLLGALCAGFLSALLMSETAREEAVEAGVAEYYLDGNDNRRFRYIPCVPEGEQDVSETE